MSEQLRPYKTGEWTKIGVGTPFRGSVSLGNMTQYRMTIWHCEDGVFIGIDGYGCYAFSSAVHWSYAKEKLGIPMDADAKNVSDLINDQLNYDIHGKERQGRYEPILCRD